MTLRDEFDFAKFSTLTKEETYWLLSQRKSPFASTAEKYSFLVQLAPERWWTFMNFGFRSRTYEANPLKLSTTEKHWRYAVQLYDYLGSRLSLEGKKVLEVGSGRGGGAAFLHRRYKPSSYVGLDCTQSNISFCQRVHRRRGLQFVAGRAESLPFKARSFDRILSIENFGYYQPFERFAAGAEHILRRDGQLLLAAPCEAKEFARINRITSGKGFKLVHTEEITEQVNAAMDSFLESIDSLVTARARAELQPMYRDLLRKLHSPPRLPYFVSLFCK